MPHERAALLLLCESVSGREHVLRITRERISSAARVLNSRDPEQILDRLRALAGELPQKVERSVEDWVRRVPPRARLRSAILVDVGARELGDRVAAELGALVTERLGPGLLAVPADRLGAVRTAVHRAEIELGPGLDRVSGHWHDPPHDDDEPEWWRPTEDDEERAELPIGRLVSGLELDPDPDWATRQPALGDPPRITIVRDPELDALLDDDQGLAPEELLLESYEFGTLVELRYAGANGTSTEQVTVAELDDARFLVEDTETGEQRWRWLKAERVATFRAGVDAAVATRRIRLLR